MISPVTITAVDACRTPHLVSCEDAQALHAAVRQHLEDGKTVRLSLHGNQNLSGAFASEFLRSCHEAADAAAAQALVVEAGEDDLALWRQADANVRAYLANPEAFDRAWAAAASDPYAP